MRPRRHGAAPPLDAELYSEVAALLGELTVAGAFRQRAELADMDDPSWDELVAVRRELMATAPAERRAVCERLSEPARRRVALLLLDRGFLQAVACAAWERAHAGRGGE